MNDETRAHESFIVRALATSRTHQSSENTAVDEPKQTHSMTQKAKKYNKDSTVLPIAFSSVQGEAAALQQPQQPPLQRNTAADHHQKEEGGMKVVEEAASQPSLSSQVTAANRTCSSIPFVETGCPTPHLPQGLKTKRSPSSGRRASNTSAVIGNNLTMPQSTNTLGRHPTTQRPLMQPADDGNTSSALSTSSPGSRQENQQTADRPRARGSSGALGFRSYRQAHRTDPCAGDTARSDPAVADATNAQPTTKQEQDLRAAAEKRKVVRRNRALGLDEKIPLYAPFMRMVDPSSLQQHLRAGRGDVTPFDYQKWLEDNIEWAVLAAGLMMIGVIVWGWYWEVYEDERDLPPVPPEGGYLFPVQTAPIHAGPAPLPGTPAREEWDAAQGTRRKVRYVRATP